MPMYLFIANANSHMFGIINPELHTEWLGGSDTGSDKEDGQPEEVYPRQPTQKITNPADT